METIVLSDHSVCNRIDAQHLPKIKSGALPVAIETVNRKVVPLTPRLQVARHSNSGTGRSN